MIGVRTVTGTVFSIIVVNFGFGKIERYIIVALMIENREIGIIVAVPIVVQSDTVQTADRNRLVSADVQCCGQKVCDFPFVGNHALPEGMLVGIVLKLTRNLNRQIIKGLHEPL